MDEVRVLVSGRGLVEAPRWHVGRVVFSDWTAGEVLGYDPASGMLDVVARASSFPLCTDWLPDGRLLVVTSPPGALLAGAPDDPAALSRYADLSGVAAGVWNDVVADGRGNVYANGAGIEGAAGIVALVTPDGVARRVADGLAFPNGMAITPDGRTLLVADSWAQAILAYDIAPDGGLGGSRTWAAVAEHPDGICIDAEGAVWLADVGTSRCVRVAEGGAVLDEVRFDRGCFACVLGGPERRTLYVTAAVWRGWEEGVEPGSGILAAVDVAVPGAGRP
ncbi:MAG: SMP-30/gluconolactonase/LRE family protein [Chloroflexota bacterium]